MATQNSKLNNDQIIARRVGLGAFLAGSIGLFFWGWPMLQHAKASVNWPTTQGFITKSSVSESTSTEGRTKTTTTIAYSYSVDGREYHSRRMTFGDYLWQPPGYEDIVFRYPVGKEMAVYYHPEKPSIGVLQPGTTFNSYMPFVFSCVFTVFGALMFFFPSGIHAKKNPDSE